jgi:hypothetical protein
MPPNDFIIPACHDTVNVVFRQGSHSSDHP